jgi:hypothetical protein
LQAKLTEIQIKIDTWEMKKQILAAELKDKRTNLKKVLEENYKMNTEILKAQGIHNKADIIATLRKKTFSLKSFPKSSPNIEMAGMSDRK